MYVRDIMTTNIVTVPSSTSIAQAKQIMDARRFRRLPIVDKGKLVGILSDRRLDELSPSKDPSISVLKMHYLLDKTMVKEIMQRDVVTVSPNMTVEASLAVAQGRKVGALVVVEDDRVVGIVTTNDFFYKIVNPLLGLGESGTRIEVSSGNGCKAMEEISSTICKLGLNIVTGYIVTRSGTSEKDIVVHVDAEDVSQLVSELESKGYKVGLRQR
ncbi:CBS and ACT domain-containing protein [Chloroflexota bacterium]